MHHRASWRTKKVSAQNASTPEHRRRGITRSLLTFSPNASWCRSPLRNPPCSATTTCLVSQCWLWQQRLISSLALLADGERQPTGFCYRAALTYKTRSPRDRRSGENRNQPDAGSSSRGDSFIFQVLLPYTESMWDNWQRYY